MSIYRHKKKLEEVNWQAAVQANNDVALYAGELSSHFLTGVFKSLFYLEQSCELSEPELFDINTLSERLETRRMTASHWLNFPLALANEDLLARRFVAEQEYEFVLLLDLSRSMTGSWFMNLNDGTWRQDPCYRMKYTAYALLNSAFLEDFSCRVIFIDQGSLQEWSSKGDDTFAFTILERIDEHILDRSNKPEPLWLWESALQELADCSNQLLVGVITDFLDPIQGHIDIDLFLSLIIQLKYAKRLIALQINNQRDLSLALGGQGASTHDLHYGESGATKGLGANALQDKRFQFKTWLGGHEDGTGRLPEFMAQERIPHQRFFSGEDINEQFEKLAYLIIQE